MTKKIKTINLTSGWRYEGDPAGISNGYRVERITDSVEFSPASIIHKKTVDELCNSGDWKVTITNYSI